MSIINRKKFNQEPTSSVPISSQPSASSQRNYSISTGFANYFDKEKLNKLLSNGSLLKGTLTVYPNGYRSGYVETEFGPINLPQTQNINRALNGDEVAVLLLETEQDENTLVNWQIGDTKSQEGQKIVNSKINGSVVGILKNNNSNKAIECLPAPNQKRQGLLLQPLDRRYPMIEVHNPLTKQPAGNQVFNVKISMWLQQMQEPAGEVESLGRVIELKELDQICEFTLQSTGIPYNYNRNIPLKEGIKQQIDEGEKALLTDCQLERNSVFELNQDILKNIKGLVDHLHKQQTVFDNQQRRLFIDKLVFTIDPDTAKDFDDSCHVDILVNDNVISFKDLADMTPEQRLETIDRITGYEIGVHIADVTHYVTSNSDLDKNAQESTTSVYITDRCIPMYPYELADGLCSLNPAVPRYVFSVVFQINKQGELIKQKVWFGKGLIVSYARLDYVCAQAMIDNNVKPEDMQPTTFFNRWPVAAGYHQAFILCVQHMNQIALLLRKQRESFGALELNNEEIRWRVDSKLNVTVIAPEAAGEAHHLIEEFMVIANSLVAMRLTCSYPACPIIRMHPAPKAEFEYTMALNDLKLGKLDMTNGNLLCKSLNMIAKNWCLKNNKLKFGVLNEAQYALAVANIFYMSNGLMRAKYVAGMSAFDNLMAHWGIHSQLYMHFTSPIRRYADDMCHRMLQASLQIERELLNDDYKKSSEYQYMPHELIINEVKSLYEYTGCLPPMDFRKLCDKMYPLADQNSVFHSTKIYPFFTLSKEHYYLSSENKLVHNSKTIFQFPTQKQLLFPVYLPKTLQVFVQFQNNKLLCIDKEDNCTEVAVLPLQGLVFSSYRSLYLLTKPNIVFEINVQTFKLRYCGINSYIQDFDRAYFYDGRINVVDNGNLLQFTSDSSHTQYCELSHMQIQSNQIQFLGQFLIADNKLLHLESHKQYENKSIDDVRQTLKFFTFYPQSSIEVYNDRVFVCGEPELQNKFCCLNGIKISSQDSKAIILNQSNKVKRGYDDIPYLTQVIIDMQNEDTSLNSDDKQNCNGVWTISMGWEKTEEPTSFPNSDIVQNIKQSMIVEQIVKRKKKQNSKNMAVEESSSDAGNGESSDEQSDDINRLKKQIGANYNDNVTMKQYAKQQQYLLNTDQNIAQNNDYQSNQEELTQNLAQTEEFLQKEKQKQNIGPKDINLQQKQIQNLNIDKSSLSNQEKQDIILFAGNKIIILKDQKVIFVKETTINFRQTEVLQLSNFYFHYQEKLFKFEKESCQIIQIEDFKSISYVNTNSNAFFAIRAINNEVIYNINQSQLIVLKNFPKPIKQLYYYNSHLYLELESMIQSYSIIDNNKLEYEFIFMKPQQLNTQSVDNIADNNIDPNSNFSDYLDYLIKNPASSVSYWLDFKPFFYKNYFVCKEQLIDLSKTDKTMSKFIDENSVFDLMNEQKYAQPDIEKSLIGFDENGAVFEFK